MRVTLINPPLHLLYKYHTRRAPLGLAYIAAVLEKNGHSVKIIDAEAFNLSFKSIIKETKKTKPEIIGITCLTTIEHIVGQIAELLKKELKIKIFVGGAHPTALPNEMLRKYKIDIVVRGEGEYTTLDLVNTIEKKGNLKNVNGISFKKNNKIITNKNREQIKNLDELPLPARHLLPMDKYIMGHDYAIGKHQAEILTSRGCYGRCRFCDRTIFGNKIRFRSTKNVLDEIEGVIKKYDIHLFSFIDDTLTSDKKRATNIFKEIINKNLNIEWDCTTRINTIDKELLKYMKSSGCRNICYGIESGSQETLDYIKKDITLDQIRKAVKLTKKAGIKVHLFMMIGFPNETREKIIKTIEFAKELDGDTVQFNILSAFPGTDLRKELIRENLIDEKEWCKIFTKWASLHTHHVTREELVELREYAFKECIKSHGRKNIIKCLTRPKLLIKKSKKYIRDPTLIPKYIKNII